MAAIKAVRATIKIPIQLGGGIRNKQRAQQMLDMGVNRVVAGTAVARDFTLAEELFKAFGPSFAVGVDAKDGYVAIAGWTETSTLKDVDFVVRMADLGAIRFIFTDIARDGMLTGVNLQALQKICAAVPSVSVTASGGVASIKDIVDLVELEKSVPNLDAVIVGKALYAATLSLGEALSIAMRRE